MIRYAIVVNARTRQEAEAYLPENYELVLEAKDVHVSGSRDKPFFVIKGEDVAGWTLDGYVIPRYASGLIGCREITSVLELDAILGPGKHKGLRGKDYTIDEQGQPRDVYTGDLLEL